MSIDLLLVVANPTSHSLPRSIAQALRTTSSHYDPVTVLGRDFLQKFIDVDSQLGTTMVYGERVEDGRECEGFGGG